MISKTAVSALVLIALFVERSQQGADQKTYGIPPPSLPLPEPECRYSRDCGPCSKCVGGDCLADNNQYGCSIFPRPQRGRKPECYGDDQCSPFETCSQGVCVNSVPPRPPVVQPRPETYEPIEEDECSRDSECQPSEVCEAGACLPASLPRPFPSTPTVFPFPEPISPILKPQRPGYAAPKCQYEQDCLPLGTCTAGICIQQTLPPRRPLPPLRPVPQPKPLPLAPHPRPQYPDTLPPRELYPKPEPVPPTETYSGRPEPLRPLPPKQPYTIPEPSPQKPGPKPQPLVPKQPYPTGHTRPQAPHVVPIEVPIVIRPPAPTPRPLLGCREPCKEPCEHCLQGRCMRVPFGPGCAEQGGYYGSTNS